ncbi:YggS family pyridoxal phosphate-dependent enzyme [soil metagenome]
MTMRERLDEIQTRIQSAAESVGRDRYEITLIAVSKNQPLDALKEAYDLGQRHFGESRLQEAEPKIARMPVDCTWHFIGNLQSNKARKIAELFDVVHTFANERQLEAVRGLVDGLIEVNIAEETQKGGVFPSELDAYHGKVVQCGHVRYRGLMAVGPVFDDPDAMRPFFRRLRELRDRTGGDWLSMGMSGDFEAAIQEGSTHVRIGTAIFGSRDRTP